MWFLILLLVLVIRLIPNKHFDNFCKGVHDISLCYERKEYNPLYPDTLDTFHPPVDQNYSFSCDVMSEIIVTSYITSNYRGCKQNGSTPVYYKELGCKKIPKLMARPSSVHFYFALFHLDGGFADLITDRVAGKVMFSRACVTQLTKWVCMPAYTWAGGICLRGGVSTCREECLPLGMSAWGVCPRGCLPRKVSARGCLPRHPPHELATAVVGTHPNGMHSCYAMWFTGFSVTWNCTGFVTDI